VRGEAYERYIAQLYQKEGYYTRLTQRNNDKGIDVIAEKDGHRVAIQCKHYSGENKVSSPAVQKASGLLTRPDIDGVVVVTTSSFTRPAKNTARKRGVNLQWIPYEPTISSSTTNNSSGGGGSSDAGDSYTESSSSHVQGAEMGEFENESGIGIVIIISMFFASLWAILGVEAMLLIIIGTSLIAVSYFWVADLIYKIY